MKYLLSFFLISLILLFSSSSNSAYLGKSASEMTNILPPAQFSGTCSIPMTDIEGTLWEWRLVTSKVELQLSLCLLENMVVVEELVELKRKQGIFSRTFNQIVATDLIRSILKGDPKAKQERLLQAPARKQVL